MDNKQEIINDYLLGTISYRALSKKYGVSRSAINRWVLEYEGRPTRSKASKDVNLALMDKKVEERLPEELVVELQRQLEQEKLRNKLLTAMIEVAEEELKIPIRKKYGTKQLKK